MTTAQLQNDWVNMSKYIYSVVSLITVIYGIHYFTIVNCLYLFIQEKALKTKLNFRKNLNNSVTQAIVCLVKHNGLCQ